MIPEKSVSEEEAEALNDKDVDRGIYGSAIEMGLDDGTTRFEIPVAEEEDEKEEEGERGVGEVFVVLIVLTVLIVLRALAEEGDGVTEIFELEDEGEAIFATEEGAESTWS